MSEAAFGDYFHPHARSNIAAAKAEYLSLEKILLFDKRDVARQMFRQERR